MRELAARQPSLKAELKLRLKLELRLQPNWRQQSRLDARLDAAELTSRRPECECAIGPLERHLAPEAPSSPAAGQALITPKGRGLWTSGRRATSGRGGSAGWPIAAQVNEQLDRHWIEFCLCQCLCSHTTLPLHLCIRINYQPHARDASDPSRPAERNTARQQFVHHLVMS